MNKNNHAGLWQDANTRAANAKAGWTLCQHCNGTGNELYSMYRACPECGGSGHTGPTPWRVRFERWLERKHYAVQNFDWKLYGLWLLSYWFCINHTFWDSHDRCYRCDTQPSDVDFEMRRVGVGKAECVDRGSCRTAQAEYGAAELRGEGDGIPDEV